MNLIIAVYHSQRLRLRTIILAHSWPFREQVELLTPVGHYSGMYCSDQEFDGLGSALLVVMNHDAAPFTIDTINATPSDILLANTWPTDQE
jgi:hypothetical protein